MPDRITVLLADDHTMVRQTLRVILETRGQVTVVAEAGDGREAVELARKHRPRIVIMDVAMPGLGGIEATRKILEAVPTARVIVLSGSQSERQVADALEAGACGYVLKANAFEELVGAIRTVSLGQTYLSPLIAGLVVDGFVQQHRNHGDLQAAALTAREREVVQLLAEGHSTKEIAAALGLSVNTIHTHRNNVMEKLGLASLAELTKYAIREGLTEL